MSKTKPLSSTARLKSNSKEVEEGKRRTHRSTWLSALKQNPQITMKALRKKLPQAYAWLLQYDPDWLKKHKPPILRRTQTALCIDWQKRDAEYAAAVRAAATHIKNIRGRPMRITKTAIGRHIGAVSLLRQKLYKMPLTSQFLLSVVETREEYAVRRVRWAANCYLHDGILPRPWQFLLKANVYSLRESPEIIHIIEATLKELVGVLSISNSSAA